MKYCRDFRSRISDYLDGEMDGGDAQRMGAHGTSCKNCRGFLQDFKAIHNLMQDFHKVEPPARFVASVCERLEETAGLSWLERAAAVFRRVSPALALSFAVASIAATVATVAVVNYFRSHSAPPAAAIRTSDRPESARIPLQKEDSIHPEALRQWLTSEFERILPVLAAAGHKPQQPPVSAAYVLLAAKFSVLSVPPPVVMQVVIRFADPILRQMLPVLEDKVKTAVRETKAAIVDESRDTLSQTGDKKSSHLQESSKPVLSLVPSMPSEPADQTSPHPDVSGEGAQKTLLQLEQQTEETATEAVRILMPSPPVTVPAAAPETKTPPASSKAARLDAASAARETAREASRESRQAVREVRDTVRQSARDAARAARESRTITREAAREARSSAVDASRDAVGDARDAVRDARDEVRDAVRDVQDTVNDITDGLL